MVIELAASYYVTFDIVSEYMEFVVLSMIEERCREQQLLYVPR
jgi:hypothetical protein